MNEFININKIYNICRVTDTGGAFRHYTQYLWDTLKTYYFCDSLLFDGNEVCLIQQTSDIDDWNLAETVGKLLFWCFIHQGSWPRYIDPLHFQYIIEGENAICCSSALEEHIPYLHSLMRKVKHNLHEDEEIEEWAGSRKIDVSY